MKTNPFTLSFGMEPTQYIARFSQSDEILGSFNSDNPPTYTYMITGVRGSGKTVMLSSLSERFSEDENWVVLDVTPDSDILNQIAAKLYSRNDLKKLFVKAKLDLSAFGLGISIENGNQIFDLETAVERMLTELKKKGTRVLVTIDEVMRNEHVKLFASVFQLLLRKKLPVFLIMTGLYENINNLQNEKTLTFLYRAPRISLEPLSIGAIARSYKKVFELDEKSSMDMAKLTKGFAFAYQALGYVYWKERAGNSRKCDIDDIIPQYEELLESYVYEKIWSELSVKEQSIVSYLADKDSAKVSDIREALGESQSSFSVYRDRLKKKGIIDVKKYGYISLQLPCFGHIIGAWVD